MSARPPGEALGEDFPCFGGPFDGAVVPWDAVPPVRYRFLLATTNPSLTLNLTNLLPPTPPVRRYAEYRAVRDPRTGAIRYDYEGTRDQ